MCRESKIQYIGTNLLWSKGRKDTRMSKFARESQIGIESSERTREVVDRIGSWCIAIWYHGEIPRMGISEDDICWIYVECSRVWTSKDPTLGTISESIISHCSTKVLEGVYIYPLVYREFESSKEISRSDRNHLYRQESTG